MPFSFAGTTCTHLQTHEVGRDITLHYSSKHPSEETDWTLLEESCLTLLAGLPNRYRIWNIQRLAVGMIADSFTSMITNRDLTRCYTRDSSDSTVSYRPHCSWKDKKALLLPSLLELLYTHSMLPSPSPSPYVRTNATSVPYKVERSASLMS